MSMTETRREAETDVEPVAASPELTGAAGWVATADHKRIGRLFMATALAFLVAASVVGALVAAERITGDLDLFTESAFLQLHLVHTEALVLLFLIPFFLGLAAYLVPLQVGAPDLAYGRGAALGYWTYLASALVFVGAYIADGGITGGDAVAVDLYLLSMVGLVLGFLVALVSILTTVVTQRAPGMTLLRTPLFSWGVLVGGGVLLLTGPVLLARLVELYIGHQGGAVGGYDRIEWFWSVPTIHLLLVPAIGALLAIVPVMAATRLREHAAGAVVLGAVAILGFGAFAQVADGREGIGSLVWVGMSVLVLLPILAVLGLIGDTARRGRFSLAAPMLFAIGAALHLVLAALAGAALVIEPLELQGTAWASGQQHLALYGAGVLAAFGAVWFWAPKIWGVRLGDLAGKAVFALVFLGALLLAVPDLVNGLVEDLPQRAATFDDDTLVGVMNGIGLAGAVLTVLGVLLGGAHVLVKATRTGRPAPADPWGGHTLEWATTSPPPRANFAEAIPVVTSPTPVLDARAGDTEVTA